MKDGWDAFLKVCLEAKDQIHLDFFMNCLLSDEEAQSIKKRMVLLHALLQGDQSQRQIAENLGVSVASITRGSNNLKRMTAEQRARMALYLGVSG